MWARKRADLIYTSTSKINKAKNLLASLGRTLVFTTRIDTAEQFCDAYHSKSTENNLENFINQNINKLAVVNLGGMGITFPNLKTILFHQLQSNEELAIQKALRACNLDNLNNTAIIYICVYKNTIDESWMHNAISGFNSSKVNFNS